MVITGIATQGYGDVSVNEWLTAYILLYSQGKEDYTFFRERNANNAQVRRVTFLKRLSNLSALDEISQHF